jgi:hypothetical protein
MTPEGKVRAHLRKQALAAGFEHRKLKWIGRRGAPDELIFWPWETTRSVDLDGPPLVIALVEVKRDGEQPEPHQQREIDRLRKAGFYVEVVDTIDACDKVIAALTRMVDNAYASRGETRGRH